MERVKAYVKCRNCGWEWLPKVDLPVECPNCKVRNPLSKPNSNTTKPVQSNNRRITPPDL
jgi:DNA-directed RNA polymerase subunit RPC12/RpoP